MGDSTAKLTAKETKSQAEIKDKLAETVSAYSEEHRPLRAYATLSTVFGTALATALLTGWRRGQIPERVSFGDVALIGVATQKLSRLLAKDTVTSFLRAPFTHYEGPSGPGEVNEKPRGKGLQLATGELLGCPFCLAQWVAAGFACGLVLAPRATRTIATIYAAETISDFLQLAYTAAEQKA
jgi:hypothetical protein